MGAVVTVDGIMLGGATGIVVVAGGAAGGVTGIVVVAGIVVTVVVEDAAVPPALGLGLNVTATDGELNTYMVFVSVATTL